MNKEMKKRYEDLVLDIDILCYKHGFRKLNLGLQDVATGETVDTADHPIVQTDEKLIGKLMTEKRFEMKQLQRTYEKQLTLLIQENERLINAEQERYKKEWLKSIEDKLAMDARQLQDENQRLKKCNDNLQKTVVAYAESEKSNNSSGPCYGMMTY